MNLCTLDKEVVIEIVDTRQNRLVLIYSDSHIQKREVETDGCHQFLGIQDKKEWVFMKQFVYPKSSL